MCRDMEPFSCSKCDAKFIANINEQAVPLSYEQAGPRYRDIKTVPNVKKIHGALIDLISCKLYIGVLSYTTYITLHKYYPFGNVKRISAILNPEINTYLLKKQKYLNK